MSWKQPNRPNNDVSQAYNSGVVKIYETKDVSAPGYKPVLELSLKYSLPYSEQHLGIMRYYRSQQNQVEIERVIRVQKLDISTQDIAITQDGKQYVITLAQDAEIYPPSWDLTLSRIEQEYGVSS